jgi:transcriptional regulator with XRE-family HTH domain
MNMKSCQRQIPACGEARPDGRRPGGQVTQKEIAEIVGIHPATVSKILNRESDYTSVNIKQKVFALAMELGYDFTQLKSAQRAQTRKPVDLPVKVVVVIYPSPFSSPSRGEGRERVDEVVWDRGQARVCDISQSGALLADLQLSKNALPLQPFRLKLTLESCRSGIPNQMNQIISGQDGLAGIEIPCQVVRLETHDLSACGNAQAGQIKVGLKFETVPEETRNRLAALCSN